MNSGESFGEAALYKGGTRSMTIRAKNTVRCIALSRDTLQNILGNKIEEVVENNWTRWSLREHDVFKNLTEVQREKWISASSTIPIEANQVIYDRGDKFTDIIIIVDGKAVDVLDIFYKNRKVAELFTIKGQFMDQNLCTQNS